MICKPVFHSVWANSVDGVGWCCCVHIWGCESQLVIPPWLCYDVSTMAVLIWGICCKTVSSLSANVLALVLACYSGMLVILCWCQYWCWMVLLCCRTTMVMLECLRGEVFANQSLPPVGCGVANTLSLTPISINLSCRISSPHIIFPQFHRVFLQFLQSFWSNKKIDDVNTTIEWRAIYHQMQMILIAI